MSIKKIKLLAKFYRIYKFELIILAFLNLGPLIILRSILAHVQVNNYGITILYHLHHVTRYFMPKLVRVVLYL